MHTSFFSIRTFEVKLLHKEIDILFLFEQLATIFKRFFLWIRSFVEIINMRRNELMQGLNYQNMRIMPRVWWKQDWKKCYFFLHIHLPPPHTTFSGRPCQQEMSKCWINISCHNLLMRWKKISQRNVAVAANNKIFYRSGHRHFNKCAAKKKYDSYEYAMIFILAITHQYSVACFLYAKKKQ